MREKLNVSKLNLRALGLWTIASGLLTAMLLFRLRSLTSDLYSPDELSAHLHAQSWHTLYDNPLELPYTFFVWLGATLGHHSILLNRAVSVVFALMAAWLFYYILTNWISRRIALLATILFVASNGYLHAARLGTAAVLQMGILLALALPILITNAPSQHRRKLFYLSAGAGAALLYVPGMLWHLVSTAIFRRRKLFRIMSRLRPLQKVVAGASALLVVAPLAWASYRKPGLLLDLVGLPRHMPSGEGLVSNLTGFVSALFYHSGVSPQFATTGSPLFTIAEIILLAMGVYALMKRPRHVTGYWLLCTIGISSILVVLGSQVFLVTLVPILYLVIAWGMYYFLDEWLTVFPRNPIARRIGVFILCAIVASCVVFHIRSYFIAWPHNKTMQATYQIKQP